MSKGMELPVNIIIFIAVAVLILASMGAFFLGFFSDDSLDNNKLFAQGCSSLRAFHSCDHNEINRISMENTNFGYVCARSGYTDTATCAKACGCHVVDSETGQSLSGISSNIDIIIWERSR